MKSYRDQYDAFEARGATILAVSTDGDKRQGSFKAKLKAPFPFIADPDGRLVALFGVKGRILNIAKRVTFIIGTDRTVTAIESGRAALDPMKALAACG